MNWVVVGFDFSPGSACAVDLAIDIANRWKYGIRLVYVAEKKEDEAAPRAEIERRNAAVAPRLQGVPLEYVVRRGNPATELVAQAVDDGAALLVVGTHGMSGIKKGLLGRNSYKTIEESPVPVLIVREDFDFNKALETIVLPLDSSDDTRQKAAQAAMFAKTFGSTVHILGLYTSSGREVRHTVDNYVAMVERYFDNAGVQHITKNIEVEKNVTLTTLDYATAVKADLIAIMTEQEKSLTSLILGNYAQQMINLSTIPVLTVRPRQVMADTVQY